MNPQTKIHMHGDGKGSASFETIQDCTDIAEFCKEQRAKGATGSGEMKHAACIPEVMVVAYCNVKGITFREFLTDKHHVKALLSDPTLADFRIWEGQV
jgi:hypothetical protein